VFAQSTGGKRISFLLRNVAVASIKYSVSSLRVREFVHRICHCHALCSMCRNQLICLFTIHSDIVVYLLIIVPRF